MERTAAALKMECELTDRDRRNQRTLNVWGLTWMVAFVLVARAIRAGWLAEGLPALAGALVAIALGLVTTAAYRRYLRELDEMHRKIEYDALAAAAGVALVGGIAFELLMLAIPSIEFSLSLLIAAIALTYAVTVVMGRRRFV